MSTGRSGNSTGSAGNSTGRSGVGTVLVIAKTPEPGRVKTRLCPPCTPQQAASIASAALQDTFAAVADADTARRVVALEGEPGPWIPADYEVIEQVSGGLGERLEAAFRWLCQTDTAGSPMIVVGMDTPQLSGAELSGALGALTEPGVDAVLGPALDGGYWTIGFTAAVVTGSPGLFDEVPMSTSLTAQAQIARLESLDLSYRILGSERDIDTWADAVAIAQRFPELMTARAVTEVLADGSAIEGSAIEGSAIEGSAIEGSAIEEVSSDTTPVDR